MSKAKEGDIVKVHYVGTFDDGKKFDSSRDRDVPLEFELGTHRVIAGFEQAVLGMEIGEKKKIRILPEDAYGPVNEELIFTIPNAQISTEKELQPDMMVSIKLPQGQMRDALILEVTEEGVKVDANHIMAGKVLNFEIELVEIVQGK